MTNKKVLITGTTGFIFGNFIRKIIYLSNNYPDKYPYTVVSLDRVNSNAVNSMYWNKNHIFHIADIRDQHIIDTIFQFEKPDIVIHGAAESSVDLSMTDPNSFITSNVLGTQNIVNSCIKYNVEKLIYISSDEVYGQLTSESDTPWTEKSPLDPRNFYSASKASGELVVRAAANASNLIFNIVRSSNNYGPRQTPDKLIPRAIKAIMEGNKIPVYGEGKQIREWLHVFDNCSAILKILKDGKPNETYNVSSGQEYSNIEVIQSICNIMNKGHNLIEFIKDPRGNAHDFRYAMNCSKINELGWKSTTKFKDGLKDTVDWLENNKWYIK
jgi:dTDP-glucose 4,6-dehydratase